MRSFARCRPQWAKGAAATTGYTFQGLPPHIERALAESGLAPGDQHPGKANELWHTKQIRTHLTNIAGVTDKALQQEILNRASSVDRALAAISDGCFAAIFKVAIAYGLDVRYSEPWHSNVPPPATEPTLGPIAPIAPNALAQADSALAASDSKPETPAK